VSGKISPHIWFSRVAIKEIVAVQISLTPVSSQSLTVPFSRRVYGVWMYTTDSYNIGNISDRLAGAVSMWPMSE